MPVKKESTVENLDTEIAREREVKTALEGKLAAAINERDSAETKRSEVAYDALSANDAESMQRLKDAERAASESNERLTSLKTALERCDEKLSRLQQQRVEVYREGKLAEYEHASAALVSLAADKVEIAVANLGEAQSEIDAQLRELEKIAFAAGIEKPAHNNIKKNLRHALGCRLKISDTWLSSASRKQFSKPLGDLFREVLSGLPTDDESNQQSAVNN